MTITIPFANQLGPNSGPANAVIATTDIALEVTKGDLVLLVQPLGHPTVNLADGFIVLS